MNALYFIFFFAIVVLIGVFVGVFRYNAAKKKIVGSNEAELKKTGSKIVVDLLSCEIKYNQYYEDNVLITICILIYTTKLADNNDYSFKSPPIYLSKERLHDRLTMQKQTSVYYKVSAPNKYYFDVEFLMEYLL